MTDEQKIVRNLAQFARNEETALRKVRTMKRVSQVGGWIVLLAAFSLAFQDREGVGAWIPTAVAAFGGAMVGLGLWFENTLVTWPVLRQFVDLERMKDHCATASG